MSNAAGHADVAPAPKRFFTRGHLQRNDVTYRHFVPATVDIETLRHKRRAAQRAKHKMVKRTGLSGPDLVRHIANSKRAGDNLKALVGTLKPAWTQARAWAGQVLTAINGKVYASPTELWFDKVLPRTIVRRNEIETVVRDGKRRPADAEGMLYKELSRRFREAKIKAVQPPASSPATRENVRIIMEFTEGMGLDAWQCEDITAYVQRCSDAGQIGRSSVGYALAAMAKWFKDRRTIWHPSQRDNPNFERIRQAHREGPSPSPFISLVTAGQTAPIKALKPMAKTFKVVLPDPDSALAAKLKLEAEAMLEERARAAFERSDVFATYLKIKTTSTPWEALAIKSKWVVEHMETLRAKADTS